MSARFVLICMAMMMAAQIGHAERLGPPDKLDALRSQLSETYTFVVRFDEGTEIDPERIRRHSNTDTLKRLDLINGAAVRMQVAQAFDLAEEPGIRQVWYLHPNLADIYVNTIAALDYNVRTLPLPSIVNLSIGPTPNLWEQAPYIDAPIDAATRAAAEAGLIPVVAAGNSGRPDGSFDGLINPWCYPEWVICVGAYDTAKGMVAAFSSRGDPARPDSWPDVIANGVDVIGPFPTTQEKSKQRKEYDEANAHFRAEVPKEKWHLYTLMSGTSQAAAITSAAAGQVLHFLKEMINQTDAAKRGELAFSLTATKDHITGYDSSRPRLTGTATEHPDGSIVYEYLVDEPWKMAKQLIVDTALPVPGAEPSAAGAGIVDPVYVHAQFGQFGKVHIEIAPSKVIK